MSKSKNVQPEPNQKYFYNHDRAWLPGQLRHVDVAVGTIAYDVRLIDGSYRFALDGLDGEFATYYGWSLVKFAPENMINLQLYRDAQEAVQSAAKMRDDVYRQVESLCNYFGDE